MNRLAKETSPYLLQHAHNPVDWYSWGEEAFQRARAEGKPLFLSIGYSACHWCHVMAHECFENEEIARVMNENFINIKVDREERPDLDSIYMQAVQAMTGSGGWPLSVFLTPGGKPFYGGTYFPPRDSRGLPAFSRVLLSVAKAYRERRSNIEEVARQLEGTLAGVGGSGGSKALLVAETLEKAFLALRPQFDKENGGFGKAPKFPQPLVHEFLLRYFSRRRESAALRGVWFTLGKMARGGIYDQLGGGFHRYATDNQWLVPHFEKMLYDNALLSRLYLHTYLVTGRASLRRIAEETCDYVLREMAGKEGGFYSTQDADTEGSEGNYYLWTPGEIAGAVGEGLAPIVNRYFGVTEKGNFEGKNILHIADAPAPELDIIIQAKAALLEKREQRAKPARDEKILAGWNGLTLASLAEAACVLDRKDYLAAAVANGSFLLDAMIVAGRLRHVFKDGQARIGGYLLDYAQVIEGLLMLHQSTLSGRWLTAALSLAQVMVDEFWDEPAASFYDTGQTYENLFIRPRDIFDGALPSGASSAALVLLKLARLTDNQRFEQIAARALQSVQVMQCQNPHAFGYWLCALDFYLSPSQEIATVGPKDVPATWELLRTLSSVWLPNKVVAGFDPSDPTPIENLPLLTGKRMIDDQPTVYICQRYACQEPITSPASLGARLRELVPPEPTGVHTMPDKGEFGF